MSNNAIATTSPVRKQVVRPAAFDTAAGPEAETAEPQESLVARDSISRLLRYGSVVPVVGGAAETLYGVREMKLGINETEIRDGKVDIVRGASSLIGSLSNLPIYANAWGVASMAHPVLAVLGVIGGVANTVNAVFDGGRDIYNGVKGLKTGDPHAKSDIAWGAVKLGAGILVAAGSFTLNPVLMYAGNIVFAAAAGIQNREQLGKFFHKLGDKVSNVAHSVSAHLHHSTPPELES